MGSRGCTRSREHRRRPLVEEAFRLDFLDPKWKDVLRLHRASGTLEWRHRGGVAPERWADFHLNPIQTDGSRLLVVDFSRDPTEAKERLILERVRVGFSQRWYARCPVNCGRRVRTLFLLPRSDRLGCRTCLGLVYRSSREHDRRVDMARLSPSTFLEARAHLRGLRSAIVTAWVFEEAQRRGRLRLTPRRLRKVLLAGAAPEAWEPVEKSDPQQGL